LIDESTKRSDFVSVEVTRWINFLSHSALCTRVLLSLFDKHIS
jgi:hypothetical protein